MDGVAFLYSTTELRKNRCHQHNVVFAGVGAAAVSGRLDQTRHVLLRFAHISSIFGLLVVFFESEKSGTHFCIWRFNIIYKLT
jgi:hypothetical protein